MECYNHGYNKFISQNLSRTLHVQHDFLMTDDKILSSLLYLQTLTYKLYL